jgi:hypothetical protein
MRRQPHRSRIWIWPQPHDQRIALLRRLKEVMINQVISHAARLSVAFAVVAAAACATTGTGSHPAAAPLPGSDACVFMREVFDWTVVDESTLIVYAPMRKDAYLLKLFEPVPELNFKERVGFEDSDHNGMLCGNGGDYLVLRDDIGPRRVPIVAFRKLTPEQLKQFLPASKTPATQPANAQPANAQPANAQPANAQPANAQPPPSQPATGNN